MRMRDISPRRSKYFYVHSYFFETPASERAWGRSAGPPNRLIPFNYPSRPLSGTPRAELVDWSGAWVSLSTEGYLRNGGWKV